MLEDAEPLCMCIHPGMLRTGGDGQLEAQAFRFIDSFQHSRQDRLRESDGVSLRAVAGAQGNGIQQSLGKKREVFRRVEVRESISTDNFSPFVVRQFISVLL